MPSKYKIKQPKPITKQGNEYIQRVYPRCTNCGQKAPLINPSYSKCYCGGTYQLFGAEQ